MTHPPGLAGGASLDLSSWPSAAGRAAAEHRRRRSRAWRRLSPMLHFIIAASCLVALMMITPDEVLQELSSYPTAVLLASAALFCVGVISSIALIRQLPRMGLDAFDPGLLLILFVFGSVAPVVVTLAFAEPLLRFQDIRLEPLLPRIAMLHLILVVAFAATYYLVNRRVRVSNSRASRRLDSVAVWALLALVLSTVSFSTEAVRGSIYTRAVGDSTDISRVSVEGAGLAEQQINQRLRRLRAYALIFAIGCLASRAATPSDALGLLFVCTVPLGLAYFSVFASRGFLMSTVLGAAAFVDTARFKGRLLTMKTLLIAFVGGMAMLQFMNAAEGLLVYGKAPGVDDLRKAVVLDYGIVENSAIVVNWIDSGAEEHLNGSSYRTALLSVLPAQIRGPITDLPRWFVARYEPAEAELGKGHGFSAVAEGYVNWGTGGVVIQGAILALLASVLRFFRVSPRLGALGPYLFAASVPISYTLFRMDVSGVLWRLKNSILDVLILAIVASLIIAVASRARRRIWWPAAARR